MKSFKLRGAVCTAKTFKALATMYAQLRDDSGEGASTFPTPTVFEGGKKVAWISYNGRVWTSKTSGVEVKE